MCVCVCVYIYIYIYLNTYTHSIIFEINIWNYLLSFLKCLANILEVVEI